MHKQATEHLLQLIKSLSPSEKRAFRLFVNRNNPKVKKLFVQLFDILDSTNCYDEKKIFKKIPSLKPSQLANVKANLYKQLLSSLRHIERNNQSDIAIRENIDYAKILYSKGLYRASLVLLDKTKKSAWQNGYFASALSVLEFEKYIESQYVTGSMYPKAKQITDETEILIKQLDLTHELSNLSISMYALYLQYGHVRKGPDLEFINQYFKSKLPSIAIEKMGFYQKLYYYQSHVWYYFMTQDFPSNYRYAQKWVDLFEDYPEKKFSELPFYIKGLHNVLSSLFMIQRYDRFLPSYEALRDYKPVKGVRLTINDESQIRLYQSIHTIHNIFLTGQYDEGVNQMLGIEQLLIDNPYNWDIHRILVLKYKVACVHIGANNHDKAITILNGIIDNSFGVIREDIQCYARILSLVTHFDLGNEILVSYMVKSVYRFLLKANQDQQVLKEIFKFLRKTPSMLESELKGEFIKLRDKLILLESDPYERRPFLYFDIISWLESKINNTRIQTEIQNKIKRRTPLLESVI